MRISTKRIIRSNFNFLQKDYPDETLEKMCFSKKRYNTKELIDEKILEIKNERPNSLDNLRGYECPICKGFHLTSK